MAITELTLGELSVTYDPNAAPDANVGTNTSPYAFSTINTSNSVSNGSFANTPITTVPEVQTSTGQNTVSPGDLPWAVVLMPTTSAGQGGIGNNKHALQPESWVYGIFLDGDNCQQPMVIGAIPGSGGGVSGGSSDGSSGSSSTGSTDPGTLPDVKAGKATIKQNTYIVYNTLRKNGFTHEQACGIMGNMQIESQFNTGAHNNIAGGHTGLVQWDATRWRRFNQMFPGQQNSAEAQTKFLIWEINNTHASYAKLIKMKPNDVTLSTIGMANVEMFGADKKGVPGWTKGRFKASGNLNGIPLNNGDLQNRIAAAKALAAKLGNNASTTPTRANTAPSTPAMNTPTS